MLDPISAIGFASSILQILSFSGGLIKRTRESYKSADGVPVQRKELMTVLSSLSELLNTLRNDQKRVQTAVAKPESTKRKAPESDDDSMSEEDEAFFDLEPEHDEFLQSRRARRAGAKAKARAEEEAEQVATDEVSTAQAELDKLSTEAIAVVDELMVALRKLQIDKASNRKWASLRQAFLSIIHEDKLNELEARINRLRGQIDTTLLFSIRESIGQVKKQQHSQAEDMRLWIEELAKGAKSHSSVLGAIKNAVDPEQDDFGIPDRMAPHLVDMILDENNENAYRATFEWVFNEEYRPAALGVAHDLITSNHCSLSADTFVSWLKSDQKLYWVTGKPGAGKSTLMKFLSSHRSLKPISKEWTNRNDSKNFSNHVDSVIELWNGEYPYPGKGRRQFRVGTYFFWNPGSPMQKSKRGLCQTLLYQLLNQDIERVADVFPERWARHEHYGGDMRGFNDTELWNALRRLLSVHDRRYLLFIDGLDEIEDKPTELADMTLEFARMPAVKICAASRPWVEFQDKFHGLPRLSVEELTKYDILNYISGHLEDSPAFSVLRAHDDAQAQTLILDVAKRASGVFLWIFVVVESLLEGLRDGDNFSKLEQRLSDLPTELDALFTRILKQVPPRYAVDASEMFQLVRAHPEDSSLLALYLADQPVSAALKAPFAPVPQATLAYYLDVMRRKVYSRCKCLLQVSTLEGEDVKVSYLHRTVRDYLQQPHIWDDIRARNSEYDADCSIAISWLQQIKMGMVSGAQLEAWRDKFIRMVYYIALNKTLTIMNKIALLDATDEVRSFIVDQIPQLKRTCQQWPWGQPWERRDVLGLLPHGSRWTLYQSTIYGVAFGADFGWYVDAKLKEQPDLVSNPINMGYPLYTAVEHGLWNVTEALLDHGADPNFSTDVMAHGHSAWLLLLKHIQTLIKRGNLKARGRGYMSLLNSFLSKGASPRAEGGSVKPETVISEVLTVLRGKEYEHEREALSGRFEQALKDDKGARRITFKGIRS